jgi:[pyruvate, water dikinase]-phosphate phosphotransferase / [pyruvate, water dikinase] kinase
LSDKPKIFHVHMISDSTGETVNSVIRAVMSQFEEVEIEEHTWALVRTKGHLERVIEAIKAEPGPVLFTIIDAELQTMLLTFCRKNRLPCIPILHRATKELQLFFGVKAKARVGSQYELDEEYFEKMDAIHYTLAHDDGQEIETLDEADVILIGPSRTSKTPTCVYLSNRGINAANIPIVTGVPLPDNLFTLEKPLVIGLTIDPDRLEQIRKSRLLSLNEMSSTDYIDHEKIETEIKEARKLYTQYKIPVIDVTRKSVEETCANILQMYTKFKEERDS